MAEGNIDKFKSGKYYYEREKIGSKKYKYFRFNGKVFDVDFGKRIGKRGYMEAYKRAFNVKRQSPLPEKWQKQLYAKSSWSKEPWINKKGGHVKQNLRPLTLSSTNQQYRRIQLSNHRTKARWGANIKQGKGASTGIINGLTEWTQHINIARHLLSVQAERFRITVGQRAMRIFELSFKYHKFYNEDTPWAPLASFTKKRRMWRGTWKGDHNSKLYEYGALAKAFTIDESIGGITRIRNKRRASSGYNKKNRSTGIGIFMAAIHNEGVPKGRKWGAAIPQRQFMGWSKSNSKSMDKVDSFAYTIADLYLFDSVFLTKYQKK